VAVQSGRQARGRVLVRADGRVAAKLGVVAVPGGGEGGRGQCRCG
jgi:hypothetical protein